MLYSLYISVFVSTIFSFSKKSDKTNDKLPAVVAEWSKTPVLQTQVAMSAA